MQAKRELNDPENAVIGAFAGTPKSFNGLVSNAFCADVYNSCTLHLINSIINFMFLMPEIFYTWILFSDSVLKSLKPEGYLCRFFYI